MSGDCSLAMPAATLFSPNSLPSASDPPDLLTPNLSDRCDRGVIDVGIGNNHASTAISALNRDGRRVLLIGYVVL